MKKTLVLVRAMIAFIAGFALVACGGGNAEEELPATAAQVESVFHASSDLFRVGSNQEGIEWFRGTEKDHLVVRYAGSVVYDTWDWFAYANRGTMSDGTDVVLVHEYKNGEDSGQATLFISGRRVVLPLLYVERAGANRLATVRNAREYPGGWLILFASFDRLSSLETPSTYAWIMYRPADGAIYDFGEYCGRCTRR